MKFLCWFRPHKWWPWYVHKKYILWRCIHCNDHSLIHYENPELHLLTVGQEQV